MKTTLSNGWQRLLLSVSIAAAFPLPANAAAFSSSTRTIYVQSTSSTKSLPGAFVDSVSTGTTDSSTSTQDSSITENASLLRLTGNGTTAAARTISGGASVAHLGESFFETNFALEFDTPYQLTGRLDLSNDVPLGGSPAFDNSLASVRLMEVGGPSLFFDDTNGSFNKVGMLPGGKSYQLRITTKLDLRTNQIFSKTNGWQLNFSASLVPEPSCILLVGLALGAGLACGRLGRRGCCC